MGIMNTYLHIVHVSKGNKMAPVMCSAALCRKSKDLCVLTVVSVADLNTTFQKVFADTRSSNSIPILCIHILELCLM